MPDDLLPAVTSEVLELIADDVDLPEGVTVTVVGLIGLERLTQDQSIRLLNRIIYTIERDAFKVEISQWAIGDLIVYGEGKYGDTYTAVMEASGYTYQTCANARYVVERFPFERRRGLPLHFAHHAVVAALKPSQQDHWLDEALANEWTSRQLGRAIQAAQDAENGLDPAIEDVKRALTRTAENVAGLWPDQWANTITTGLLRPLKTRDVQDDDWRAFLVALQDEIDILLKEVKT